MVFTVRPPDKPAEQYRKLGVWRDESPLADLQRWRERTPDATAIIAHRADSADTLRLTYREFAQYVERCAGALYQLGVGPGQVVATQLPNWWETSALILACARVGAVVAPIMPTIRQRELERVLARTKASVCVTAGHWAGFEHAAALAEIAPRLPALRHRVVLGGQPAAGVVDFAEYFLRTPWEERHPVALRDAADDPDRAFLVLFTSGTTGEPKGVLHSHNTLYTGASTVATEEGLGQQDTVLTPHPITHAGGMIVSLLIPLLSGMPTVLLDMWSPEAALDLMVGTGTTFLAAAPPFLGDLIAAQRERPRDLSALRLVIGGAMPIPRQLVAEVPEVLGVPLRSFWGMTEVTGITWTRSDDPVDWAAHSDGRPSAALEIDLRSDGEITPERPGRLFVRGAGVCLATIDGHSGELRIPAEQDDGWYDTGDLAVSDGRGGIRLRGRAADRVGSGSFMLPVTDIENELLDHPVVDEVALVGYPDAHSGELPCAVVVARPGPPPTLDDLREYLRSRGMTEWYHPTRLEMVAGLPRNGLGKVRKELLRSWLRGETTWCPEKTEDSLSTTSGESLKTSVGGPRETLN